MKVPFIDLKAQYDLIWEDIQTSLNKVLESTAFSGGPFVAQFEKEFAAYCGCKHAIGVGSGTDALWVTLLAIGIGPGDEVITVPNSFIATAEAISYCGARPVFVDIDESTYNMDPNKLEDYLKKRFASYAMRSAPYDTRSAPKPKAVIPVHLFGQSADMDSIMEIAQKYGLFVVEDACQAHGAEYLSRKETYNPPKYPFIKGGVVGFSDEGRWRKAGTIGNAGCFSFYPGKNLGAYGEAGAVVTNNDTLAEKIKIFRDHGQPVKYCHDCIGWNARMDGFQGAVLGVKLRYLDEWNESRRRNARRYNNLLSSIEGMKIPKEAEYAMHVYHLYVIRTENRDELIRNLSEKNISCGIHYPLPIHLQKAYEFLGLKKGAFPAAEKYAGELVSLPMYPELTEEQIAYVVEGIKEFIKQAQGTRYKENSLRR
jgi:dTDP-4-amino-4,6-dideoxygalactose transaminase